MQQPASGPDADTYHMVYWRHSLWMSMAGPQPAREPGVLDAVRATRDRELASALDAVLLACRDWDHAPTAEAWYRVMDQDAEFLMLLARRVAAVPS